MSERTRAEWLDHIYARANHLRWRRRTVAGGVALGLVAAVLVPTVVLSGGDHAKKVNVASGATTTTATEGGTVAGVDATPESGTGGSPSSTTTSVKPGSRTSTSFHAGVRLAPAANSSAVTPATPPADPVVFVMDDPSSRNGTKVFVIQPDGSGLRMVSHGDSNDQYPLWAPDRTRLLYQWSYTVAPPNLFVVKSDGSGQHKLIGNPQHSFGADWSPDGARLAFRGDDGTDTPSLFVADQDGANEHQILLPSTLAAIGGVAWSPDSAHLAYGCGPDGANSNMQVCVVNPDGSELHQLTSGSGWVVNTPRWSPDGSRLVFTAGAGHGSAFDVYTVGADGAGLRRLIADTFSFGNDTYELPATLVLSRAGDVLFDSAKGIYAARPDGSNLRLVVSEARARRPSWAPDGKSLAFDQDRAVFWIGADGSGRRQLSTPGTFAWMARFPSR